MIQSHSGLTLEAYQRRVIHRQHDHTLMSRAILAPLAHMRLHHITTVKERHLAIGLHPELVPGVRCDHIESCDVHSELVMLAEFADAGPNRQKIWAGDG